MGEKTFISYARIDGDFALRLARDLRAASVDAWIDQLDIRAGDTWDRAVEDALRECTGLLVVLSPDSVASRSVMDEVSFALDENKRVIPVLHRECSIPFRLRRVQYTDFTSDYDDGLSRLVHALGGVQPAAGQQHHHGTREPSARSYNAGRPVRRFVSAPPRWRPEGPSPRSRFITALLSGLVGAMTSWIVGLLIFDLEGDADVVLFGTSILMSGPLWSVAGAVAGPRRIPWVCAVATSLAVLGIWIVVFGMRQDVVWYALLGGWPGGGILGAVIGGAILGSRGVAE
jgi:hypothetical protein